MDVGIRQANAERQRQVEPFFSRVASPDRQPVHQWFSLVNVRFYPQRFPIEHRGWRSNGRNSGALPGKMSGAGEKTENQNSVCRADNTMLAHASLRDSSPANNGVKVELRMLGQIYA